MCTTAVGEVSWLTPPPPSVDEWLVNVSIFVFCTKKSDSFSSSFRVYNTGAAGDPLPTPMKAMLTESLLHTRTVFFSRAFISHVDRAVAVVVVDVFLRFACRKRRAWLPIFGRSQSLAAEEKAAR